MEVVAINDLTEPKMLAHLLKYDSSQGAYRGHEVALRRKLHKQWTVHEIPVYKEAGRAESAMESTSTSMSFWNARDFYTSKAKSQAHIDAGAKKVLISAPAGNDLPTIVYGVNHETLTAEAITLFPVRPARQTAWRRWQRL